MSILRVSSFKGEKSAVRTEILAGITTFLTMAYIIVVNPQILAAAGVPFEQAFTATIIAILVGTLIMAFFANYPIAIAPAMGLNGYFTYSVVQAQHVSYRVAFAAVFVAALCFVLLSLTPLHTKLIEAIPVNLRHAIAAGIGLFIAFIGLRVTGLVLPHPSNLVQLGNLRAPMTYLTLIGLAVTLLLMALRVYGALFIGMVITGILAFFLGFFKMPPTILSVPTLPEGILVYNPVTAIRDVISSGLYAAVFSFLLVPPFDSSGAVLGIAKQAGLLEENKLPRAGRAFFANAFAMLMGSMFGTSPTAASIESAAGVAAGGRTGLTALVVAMLFLVAAFFTPLVGAIASVTAITGPALIIVGALMAGNMRHIRWDEFDESFPAFLVILTMPLTSSIATGIAFGFASYPLLKVASGKWREVHALVYMFGVLFLCDLIFFAH